MIKTAENPQEILSYLYTISANNPFACRIISLYNTYSFELPFVDYWLVIDNNNNITGAIARSGTDFILCLTKESNVDEVSSFMRVAGAESVLCDGNFNVELYGYKQSVGVILERKSLYKVFSSDLADFNISEKEAYELISSCADENFIPPNFDDFYVDVNHKLRHNAMRICGLRLKGELASIAMTVAESNNAAVLGAVSCKEKFRKSGFGSAVVKTITNELIKENKTVYLHRAENENIAFYDSLGFTECGLWKEYRFERR